VDLPKVCEEISSQINKEIRTTGSKKQSFQQFLSALYYIITGGDAQDAFGSTDGAAKVPRLLQGACDHVMPGTLSAMKLLVQYLKLDRSPDRNPTLSVPLVLGRILMERIVMLRRVARPKTVSGLASGGKPVAQFRLPWMESLSRASCLAYFIQHTEEPGRAKALEELRGRMGDLSLRSGKTHVAESEWTAEVGGLSTQLVAAAAAAAANTAVLGPAPAPDAAKQKSETADDGRPRARGEGDHDNDGCDGDEADDAVLRFVVAALRDSRARVRSNPELLTKVLDFVSQWSDELPRLVKAATQYAEHLRRITASGPIRTPSGLPLGASSGTPLHRSSSTISLGRTPLRSESERSVPATPLTTLKGLSPELNPTEALRTVALHLRLGLKLILLVARPLQSDQKMLGRAVQVVVRALRVVDEQTGTAPVRVVPSDLVSLAFACLAQLMSDPKLAPESSAREMAAELARCLPVTQQRCLALFPSIVLTPVMSLLTFEPDSTNAGGRGTMSAAGGAHAAAGGLSRSRDGNARLGGTSARTYGAAPAAAGGRRAASGGGGGGPIGDRFADFSESPMSYGILGDVVRRQAEAPRLRCLPGCAEPFPFGMLGEEGGVRCASVSTVLHACFTTGYLMPDAFDRCYRLVHVWREKAHAPQILVRCQVSRGHFR
jgi:hypothetical protein